METGKGQPDYWQRNLRLTGILLTVWFTVTFVVGFFARSLSFSFFGWPFSFWVASQGALIVFCLIIWVYARRMQSLDEEEPRSAEENG